METSLVTCRTLDDFYHVDRRTFEKQYKEILSGYREWRDLGHADKWLVFPENIGPQCGHRRVVPLQRRAVHLCDQPRPSLRGRLPIAIVEGTKSEDVAEVLNALTSQVRISEGSHLGFVRSMRKIVSRAFPKAKRVIDRSISRSLPATRCRRCIRHRWDAIQKCK